MKPRLDVHIAELVLHGFAPAERHAVADAIARALEAELGGRTLHAAPPSAERIDAGRVAIPRADRTSGASIGRALADAIAPRHSANVQPLQRGRR